MGMVGIPRFLITGGGADIGRIRRIRKSLRSRGIAEILRFGGVRRGVPECCAMGVNTGLCLAGGCIPAGVVSGVWIC